jgi:hypothetical protein
MLSLNGSGLVTGSTFLSGSLGFSIPATQKRRIHFFTVVFEKSIEQKKSVVRARDP